MTVLRIAALGAGVFAALSLLSTFALPETARVVRTRTIAAPPATLYALAVSNRGYQRFNPFASTDPDLAIDLFGPDAGVGSGFHFAGREGSGTQTVARAIEDRQVTYAIDMGVFGQPTQTIHLEPSGEGTRVRWEMESPAGYNPVRRLFNLVVPRMMGPTLDRGLANLAAAV